MAPPVPQPPRLAKPEGRSAIAPQHGLGHHVRMSSDMGRGQPTYPGGIEAVLTQMEGRRDPFRYAPGEGLPPADIDLRPLTRITVKDPDGAASEAPPFRSSYHRKRYDLRKEFTGRSELCFLHGLLVAHLRKRTWPDQAPGLFQRVWAEQGAHLLDNLGPRWLVSAITTFGDHGTSPSQRATGLALSTLCGTMKLYETERLFSGTAPDTAWAPTGRIKAPLALDMAPYALRDGGLDVNMLGRLWQEADSDTVIRPLAHRLIDMLIGDDRTVFRRIAIMRALRDTPQIRAPQPAPAAPPAPKPTGAANVVRVPPGVVRDPTLLRWGLVCTTNAPLPQIARFAAHHLDLGASELHLYLDAPDDTAKAWLERHPALRVTSCDEGYWLGVGKNRPDGHRQRQALNATRALRATAPHLHWLGHLDVDEFLLGDDTVAWALAAADPDIAFVRLEPVEALAPAQGLPTAFKRTPQAAGRDPALLEDLYPTFGLHLPGGFLSHTIGKPFARTGLPGTRLALHALRHAGREVGNRANLPALRVAHLHAPDWDTFRNALAFRCQHGGYPNHRVPQGLSLSEVLEFVQQEVGPAGLQAFFDEVCADTRDHRAKLAAHDMLITADLDLDAKVARHFGDTP